MHLGGSHTTHITGSNAVDARGGFNLPLPGSLVPSLRAQSFQNTRHGQAYPDRFSGSADHSVHEVTNELSV